MNARRQGLTSSPSFELSASTLSDIKNGAERENTNTQGLNIQNAKNTAENLVKQLGFDPLPNEMSEVSQPSYHFSFYLDSDLPDEQNKGNIFVIAETGLTGMNIQEVNIDQMVGPNFRTKNATATNVTIKIYEPMGALLPDLLFQAAVRKQIRNYLKAPWFLKLKLWGYDGLGNVVTVGKEWRWQLVLIDIATQVNESGAVHTITAMPLSEVALNDQYCMLPQSTTAPNSTTVGDALKAIVASMNKDAVRRYGSSTVPFLEYVIEDRPYPYDTKVGVKSPFENRITSSQPTVSNQATAHDYNTQTGQFSPGTDIPAVVDMLMSRCETAVKMARISREIPPTTGDDTENEVKDVFSIMHRVDTKVEYRSYDPILGDYAKRITFVVRPFTSLRLLTSMGRALSFDREKSLNRQKASFAKSSALMKKQYDYLFTGLNTEIEKFDINLNFTWAVAVPQFQAQQTMSGTPAQVDNSKSLPALQLDLSNKNKELTDAETQISNFDGQLTGQTITTEQTERRRQLLINRDRLLKEADDLSRTVGAKKDQVVSQIPARRLPPEDDGRIVDGEDLIYKNARGEGDNKRYLGADQGSKSFLPITINQDANNPGIRTSTGTPTDNNPNKSMYGALLNQLYGTFDGNLQSIELEIRGDPYWLGVGDEGTLYEELSNDTTPNFMNGEHIFVFRFKMPLGYDEVTGTVSVQGGVQAGTNASNVGDQADAQRGVGVNSNIFTGFYATVQVQHRFSAGKFSQVLNATRIPGWTYENIIEGREADVTDLTSYNTAAGPESIPNPTTSNSTPGAPVGGAQMDEQALLALTLLQEAGGEGSRGMQAVGNVIINRATKGIRGNTVSQVIMSPKQFSCWNDVNPRSVFEAKKNSSAYAAAYALAGNLLSGRLGDVTGGATSYHANTVRPVWAVASKRTTVIGNHIFYKGV